MLKAVTNLVNVSQITGVLPVVNGGTGVTTSTGTGNTVLSAAPTLSGNVTLSTGNLIVASGQGIDFSATSSGSGTMTSELLSDYEEGTWTPTQGAGLTVVGTFNSSGRYTKTGRTVVVQGTLGSSTTVAAAAANEMCGGLPFTSAFPVAGIAIGVWTAPVGISPISTSLYNGTSIAATDTILFCITYSV